MIKERSGKDATISAVRIKRRGIKIRSLFKIIKETNYNIRVIWLLEIWGVSINELNLHFFI